ncbi:hypothetical protein [Prescottella equi]
MADDYDEDGGGGGEERRGTASDRSSGGIPFGGKLLIGAVALTTLPGTIATTVASLLAVERRRIRGRWWTLWAALTAVVGLAVSGSVAGWLTQPLRLPAWLLVDLAGLPIADAVSGVDGSVGEALTAAAESGLAAALLGQVLFGLPVGFAITAIYTRVRRFKREKLGEIEGPEFSNWRPVGHLDRLRARRVADRIRAGHFTFAPESEQTA